MIDNNKNSYFILVEPIGEITALMGVSLFLDDIFLKLNKNSYFFHVIDIRTTSNPVSCGLFAVSVS